MSTSTPDTALLGLDPVDGALVAALPAGLRAVHGIPDAAMARDRQHAAQLVGDALGDHVHPGGIRTSALGPAFSTDIDVHLHTWPQAEHLLGRGWLPLDTVLHRIGSRDVGRWAVTENGRVLAALDLTDAPPPDPLEAVLLRCRRRGEVRLRDVLELRVLSRRGTALPDDPVVVAAAALERRLGGSLLPGGAPGAVEDPDVRESSSARTSPDPSPLAPLPLALPGAPLARARRWAGQRRDARRPRLVVALSGVDGAGKSTLARGLVDQLQRAGVPAGVVWSRPGLGLGGLRRLALLAKRSLGQNLRPGIEAVASGQGDLASRRGVIGWGWSLIVTLAFLVDAHRQHRRVSGVAVYDRHVIDALVTLDFAYRGCDLRLQRALVQRLLPREDLALYLDVPAPLAVSRKPGDVIGVFAVRSQLDLYRIRRASHPRLHVLDAARPPADVVAEALRLLVTENALGPHRPWRRSAARVPGR